MFAPWWPPSTLFLVLLLVLAALTLLLIAVVAYKARSERQAGSTQPLDSSRPCATWQAGRWDSDPRHTYVANVGDDTAYEVSVTTSDRVLETARTVPPYRADRLSSPSGPPCYLNFCVDLRRKRPVFFGPTGGVQSVHEHSVLPEGFDIVIQVRWRSENGERFTEIVHVD
ncbi:hypothetical protein A9W96_11125 [Mycobacterium sp. 1245852.3]|nr:hypothetical protein A9W96_11125 [Mycobacterium sp. 1245852.3]